jgi:tripartite-type tricarboxylate transporter receptor subunit TctC
MYLKKITGLGAALIALTFGLPSASRSQDWPNKPVKIVVAFAAVTSSERVPAFKDSPTFAELGLSGVAWFWLTAPANLPPDIVGKLNNEVRRIVGSPEIRRRFESDALVTMDVDSAAPAGIIAREVATWGPLAKDIGLRVQ